MSNKLARKQEKLEILKGKYKLYVITILFIVCFLFVNTHTFAAISSTSDLSRGLSANEVEEIADFSNLEEMIGQIFEISSDMGTPDLSDPIKLMFSLISRILVVFGKGKTRVISNKVILKEDKNNYRICNDSICFEEKDGKLYVIPDPLQGHSADLNLPELKIDDGHVVDFMLYHNAPEDSKETKELTIDEFVKIFYIIKKSYSL